ncbi:MAG: hypothetical protein QW051_04550 [Candidatus Aenigmatarchaeota archaeon]
MTLGVFKHRILVYNFDQSSSSTLIGTYFGGKISVKGFFQGVLFPDPEDIVVINLPIDIVQAAFIELPPVKNEKDVKRIVELELKSAADINEDINVGYVKSIQNKVLALYVRKSDYLQYKLSRNIEFEPDVAYPNIFAELVITKKLPGYWMYLVLGRTNSGIVIMDGNSIIGMRIIDFALEDINKIVKEETGFEILEIEQSGNEELIEATRKIIETLSSDILGLIEREIIISINTTEIERIAINQVTGIALICDFAILRDIILQSQWNFREKVSEAITILNIPNKITFADAGLLYRGGLQLGKVKSIKW